MDRARIVRWSITMIATTVLLLAGCAPTKKAAPQLRSAVFECTGGAQTWVVPPGVTAAGFDVYGAAGGPGGTAAGDPPGTGGKGGRATAGLPVTPDESIQIDVGCRGGTGAVTAGGTGGLNGGGNGGAGTATYGGGGGGGGASDVRRGGSGVGNRVLVGAGGGGGAGGCPALCTPDPDVGGAGAHPIGEDGAPMGFSPGKGGTQTAGGAAGAGGSQGETPGGPNQGGMGGTQSDGGGGGGSGLFGGGGAGSISGGGGGSSFGPSGATFENGVRAGDGLVVVYWVA